MFAPISNSVVQTISPINNALRFRGSNSSSTITNSIATATNQSTFAVSMWVKRGTLGTVQTLIGQTNVSFEGLQFNGSDNLVWYRAGTATLTTTAVFRDPTAWLHIVVRSTGSQVQIYVNNVQVGSASYTASLFNKSGSMIIGANAGNYFDGYIARVAFVDGQSLLPTSFGYFNSSTNSWASKSADEIKAIVDGTGNNNFFYDFDNGTSLTTLGYDKSTHAKNATLAGFSLAAGYTYDWVSDTPTSNYCSLNSLNVYNAPTLANANSSIYNSVASYKNAVGTLSITRPTYFEVTITGSFGSSRNGYFGVVSNPSALAYTTFPGGDATGWSIGFSISAFYVYHNNISTSPAGSPAVGTVLGVAVNPVTGKIWFSINGNWVSGDPSTGASPSYSNVPSEVWPIVEAYQTGPHYVNFGQQPFVYPIPTGFVTNTTKNQYDPLVKNPARHFDAAIWTGDGTGARNIGINCQFVPGFVWEKTRNVGYSSQLYDSVRGFGNGKELASNTIAAEGGANSSLDGYLSGVTNTQLQVGAGSVDTVLWNESAKTYVAWLWKTDSTYANSDGSVSSSVAVNTEGGFSAVTYTAPASGDFTVGHGLSVAPKLVITKARNGSALNWAVYHGDICNNQQFLRLNTTDAKVTGAGNIWGTSSHTATTIGLTSGGAVEASKNCVAYCFAEIPGYSKIGTFVGNSSTDGPYVHCGFRPAFILIKVSSATSDWLIFDTKRNTFNSTNSTLYPDLPNIEATNLPIDLTATGFKVRYFSSNYNLTGATHIFYAVAEQPLKYSNAR